MAERLSPPAVPIRITSTPERTGSARHWLRRSVAVLVSTALLLAGAVAILHTLGMHRSAAMIRATSLVPSGQPAAVLAVIARPGQEVTMAGTLAALADAGADVTVLPMTAGESQPPQLPSAGRRLVAIRSDELARSAQLLGAQRVLRPGFADGEVLLADPADVTRRIAAAIEQTRPSVLITVADLTGQDTDSRAIAAYAVAAAQAEGSGVSRVWTVTRGDRESRWNAMLGSAGPSAHRPAPMAAVRIGQGLQAKSAAIAAHGTQSPDLVRATYPWSERVPAWAYFRFWDREYFALAWGLPLG